MALLCCSSSVVGSEVCANKNFGKPPPEEKPKRKPRANYKNIEWCAMGELQENLTVSSWVIKCENAEAREKLMTEHIESKKHNGTVKFPVTVQFTKKVARNGRRRSVSLGEEAMIGISKNVMKSMGHASAVARVGRVEAGVSVTHLKHESRKKKTVRNVYLYVGVFVARVCNRI